MGRNRLPGLNNSSSLSLYFYLSRSFTCLLYFRYPQLPLNLNSDTDRYCLLCLTICSLFTALSWFAGDNPKTDFRGMGLLGLQQLVMFAELYPRQAQAMLLAYSVDNLKGLPFAITGINLTGDLITLLRSGALHTFLYTHGPYRSSVDQLYATFFERMFQKWQAANPPNIMSFHKIHTELLQEMTEELKTNSVVVIQKSKNRI